MSFPHPAILRSLATERAADLSREAGRLRVGRPGPSALRRWVGRRLVEVGVRVAPEAAGAAPARHGHLLIGELHR